MDSIPIMSADRNDFHENKRLRSILNLQDF